MRNRAKDITITELNRELMVLKTNGFPEGQLSTSYSSIVKGKKNNELENVILAKVAKQIKDKESKQKNITIIGIKEADNTLSSEEKTNEDKQNLGKILSKMQIDETKMKKFFRLRKTNSSNQPGLIIVEFHDLEDQTSAIKNSRLLKNDEEFKNIYINRDLTPAELELDKKLRTERNKKNSELQQGEGRLKYGHSNGHDYYFGIR